MNGFKKKRLCQSQLFINLSIIIISYEQHSIGGACAMGKSLVGKKYEHGMDAEGLQYGFITDSRGIIVRVFDKAHFDERCRALRRVRRPRAGGSK